jgi:hypothetical protein
VAFTHPDAHASDLAFFLDQVRPPHHCLQGWGRGCASGFPVAA